MIDKQTLTMVARMAKGNILIIQQDARLRQLLRYLLEVENYQVMESQSVQALPNELSAHALDVAILEADCGVETTTRYINLIHCQLPFLPVILFLPERVVKAEKIALRKLPVSYQMQRPFNPVDLMPVIERCLYAQVSPIDEALGADFAMKVFFDDKQRTIAINSKKRVKLSKIKYKLFKIFYQHPGRTFSRHELLESVWGNALSNSLRMVDDHISRLRKIISEVPLQAELQTVQGEGYRFLHLGSQ